MSSRRLKTILNSPISFSFVSLQDRARSRTITGRRLGSIGSFPFSAFSFLSLNFSSRHLSNYVYLPPGKKCILTISRPNGQTRSYTSEATFSRKSDAKARAAAIAVKLGAADFISHGYKDASKKQIKLVPLDSLSAEKDVKEENEKEDTPSEMKESTPEVDIEDDDASREISQYCKEWRAGVVKPRWVFFQEHKSTNSKLDLLPQRRSLTCKNSIWLCPGHRAHVTHPEALFCTTLLRDQATR